MRVWGGGGGGVKNPKTGVGKPLPLARAGDGAFSRERGHARRVACGWGASLACRDGCGGRWEPIGLFTALFMEKKIRPLDVRLMTALQVLQVLWRCALVCDDSQRAQRVFFASFAARPGNR